MINKYINKLLENLGQKPKKPVKIDLILDGGLFNGSYLVGALLFLKKMEKEKYIIIDKISGASIGSLVALLYKLGLLDISNKIYKLSIEYFYNTSELKTYELLFNKIKPLLPKNFYKKIKNKIYISYYNIIERKKIIKSKFKNNDDLLYCILKSSYIPFLSDGNFLYKNKYIDGMNPYIFPATTNKKRLYLDLYGMDKFFYIFSVKNERNNLHRVLSGILDIHFFFIKNKKTNLCSFIEDWSLLHIIYNTLKHYIIEKIMLYTIYYFYQIYYYFMLFFSFHFCYKVKKSLLKFFIHSFCF
jgi:hypothetical protein